jgi:amino acid permease
VFVTAAFAFSGTELVGLAAAESENPAKALPGAVKQVFWRITLYVGFECHPFPTSLIIEVFTSLPSCL